MIKKGSYRNNIQLPDEFNNFKIDKVVVNEKNSSKKIRIMSVRANGKIIVKNKRPYSFSEYSQKMSLLVAYSRRIINLINFGSREDAENLHYTFEEYLWPVCLPRTKRKIVAVGNNSAYAIRPFATKWAIKWCPVISEYEDKKWSSLKIGIFGTFSEALKALVRTLPALNYIDSEASVFAVEAMGKIKEAFEKKSAVRQQILDNLEKLKK